MVKNLKVDLLYKVTASTTSMVSVKDNKNQPEQYYETLDTYQGLPCPYGGYYGFYYPSFTFGSVGESKDNNGYYDYGTEVQYPDKYELPSSKTQTPTIGDMVVISETMKITRVTKCETEVVTKTVDEEEKHTGNEKDLDDVGVVTRIQRSMLNE